MVCQACESAGLQAWAGSASGDRVSQNRGLQGDHATSPGWLLWRSAGMNRDGEERKEAFAQRAVMEVRTGKGGGGAS